VADRDVVEVRLALVLEAQQPREDVVGDLLPTRDRRLARVDQPVEVRAPQRRVLERSLARLGEVVDVDEQLPEDVARPACLGLGVGAGGAEVGVDRADQGRVGELGDDVDLLAGARDELAREAEHRLAEAGHVLPAYRAVHRGVVVVIERRVVDAEDERTGDGLHLRPVEPGGEALRIAEHLLDVLGQGEHRQRLRRDDRLVVAHEGEQARRGLVGDLAEEVRDVLRELVGAVAEALADLVVEAHRDAVSPSCRRRSRPAR